MSKPSEKAMQLAGMFEWSVADVEKLAAAIDAHTAEARAEQHAKTWAMAMAAAAMAAEVWRRDEPTDSNPFAPNYGQARVDAGKCIRALPCPPLNNESTKDEA